MPIECQIEVLPVEQERFHGIDRLVMRHAFDMHNTLGRLCDERIYQDELAQRCLTSGFDTHREVEVRVSHADFSKAYFLDLLVERCSIYELKTVEAFAPGHRQQLINYLLLTGLNHGKLINFRSASVESQFVSTRVGAAVRKNLLLSAAGWLGGDPRSRRLREVLESLLSDWGGFLDLALYREALLHLLQLPDAGLYPVEITVSGRVLGSQNMCLLDQSTAWHLSGIKQHVSAHEAHLVRLLSHTRLQRLHWINLDHQTVTLKTLAPPSLRQVFYLQK